MNDKLKHFLACAAIAAIILAIFAVFVHRPVYGWDAGIAAAIVFLVAAMKELIWDELLHKGEADYYDFFWGISGGWAMILLWKIVETIII
jgi:hypothetical protein